MDKSGAKRGALLKATLFFMVWLLLLGLAYWYFLIKPQQWFDATQQQPPLLADSARQQALREQLRQHFPQLQDGRAWFVRFKQSGCQCERFVELYHQSFSARADPARMQVISVDLAQDTFTPEQLSFITEVIPATPSVALFNPQGAVNYFGPYHQEGICNAENSYLEPVLQALAQGQDLSILNTLVFGCFCSTR
ncbi:DUF6436 domain-containing protein [Ketobacter sp.]|uniref:DUF6436 domain-containing protein n=1 Tax=Ketobacter sp. TaxID=2083498 RepID=UPI000F2BEB70|nr:DUF6436 domain-containing protein [Ketobacter sp.]RLT95126.1 MAG: hypothetical protein D9N14_15615 [Ketobacter sp.]